MNLNSIRTKSFLIVEVNYAHIDAENSGAFKSEIMEVLNPACDTILDLSTLNFIDSSGLGVLLSCMRRVRATGGQLILCGLQSTVQSIVEQVHLKRVITICSTRDQAIEILNHE